MGLKVRLHFECEIELDDDLPVPSRSVEGLRASGARLGAVRDAARDAVEAVPGARLLWWTSTAGPIERTE